MTREDIERLAIRGIWFLAGWLWHWAIFG